MGNSKQGWTMAMLSALLGGKNPMDSTPDAIIASEKAGQAAIVNEEMLPVDIRGISSNELGLLGFKFGEPVNELFVKATLPAGWYKEGSNHDMWSYIYDDQGRQRASIFYKAAWYDMSAVMYWTKEESE